LLLQGPERLEYRGYDSAGRALREEGGLVYVRAVGNLQNLKREAGPNGSRSTHGLGHTRWATHGGVTERNAHPLTGCDDGKLSIVLNGIVENYRELRESLSADGHAFSSETDAETVVHLIERHYRGDLVEAVRAAYRELEGHFAFVAIHHDHPDLLVGARLQCPLVVGIGVGEMFLASNAAAFLRETRLVQFPDDGDIVAITPDGAVFTTLDGTPVERDSMELDWDDEGAAKGGYETFMLKEIYDQPEAVAETIGDRVRHGTLVLEGLGMTEDALRELRRHLDEGAVGRLVLQRGGHAERDHAARADDPGHLPQGRRRVGEEHQRHLAQHHVEGAVGERQGGDVASPPLQVRPDPAGDGEHGLVEVHAHHAPVPGEPVGDGAGDDAGAAGGVEDRLSGVDAGQVGQERRPLGEERRHEPGLVQLGRPGGDLERLGVPVLGGHGAPSVLGTPRVPPTADAVTGAAHGPWCRDAGSRPPVGDRLPARPRPGSALSRGSPLAPSRVPP